MYYEYLLVKYAKINATVERYKIIKQLIKSFPNAKLKLIFSIVHLFED